jgi:hypothetical protein
MERIRELGTRLAVTSNRSTLRRIMSQSENGILAIILICATCIPLMAVFPVIRLGIMLRPTKKTSAD